MASRIRLTELELAVGTALGLAPDVAALRPTGRVTPRAALEGVVATALRRPPCLVAFSGGRDSSVVLAVAAAVARRDGLALPVPVTHVFPDAPDSDETQWQQAVVAHLGLPQWRRLRWTDELDVVGPFARRALAVVGSYAPANLHFLVPIVDLARGGSLLTGSGGDELFGLAARPVAARVIHHPLTWRPRDVPDLVSGLAPLAVRRRSVRRADGTRFDWLTPLGQRRFTRAFADWLARAPLRYDDTLCGWLWRSRTVQHGLQVHEQLGRAGDTRIVNPFEHPEFLTAFGGLAGVLGPGGRGSTLRALAGDLLPASLLARTTKAGFRQAFITGRTRRAAAAITAGLDSEFVDGARLRRAWERDEVSPQSLVLLQRAALALPAPD